MNQTVDGKIAKHSNQLVDWTSIYDKRFFQTETKKAGVVIMGSKTFDTLPGPLPDRFNIIMTRDKQKCFEGSTGTENFAFTTMEPENIIHFIKYLKYKKVIVIGGSEINTLFLKAGLIDELILTISPKLFGSGLSLAMDDLDIELNFKSQIAFYDGTILLKYNVIK